LVKTTTILMLLGFKRLCFSKSKVLRGRMHKALGNWKL